MIYLFHKSLTPRTLYFGLRTDSTDFMTGAFLLIISVLLLILVISLLFLFLFCFVSVWQMKLANRQLSEPRKYSLAYCIVSHRVRLVLTVITVQ